MERSSSDTGHSRPGVGFADLNRSVTALYVHVPYCRAKCRYCAFGSRPVGRCGHDEPGAVIETILRHADEVRTLLAHVRTIYVGGGTPTVLDEQLFDLLLASIAEAAPSAAEFTVEANPVDLDERRLRIMRVRRVTRLSLGVQTLRSDLSRVLGRRLTTLSQIGRFRRLWQGELSADLLFGVTEDSLRQTAADARALADNGIDHLSVYELDVEPGTPLAADSHPDSRLFDGREEAWIDLLDTIESAGLVRYEVSSFASHEHYCEHNRAYWRGDSYIGLGPSAVSTVTECSGVVRLEQPRDHGTFVRQESFYHANREDLDQSKRILERFMLSLRTVDGVDRKRFRSDFGIDPVLLVPESLAELTRLGLLRVTGTAIAPTRSGIDLLNGILTGIAAELDRGRAGHTPLQS